MVKKGAHGKDREQSNMQKWLMILRGKKVRGKGERIACLSDCSIRGALHGKRLWSNPFDIFLKIMTDRESRNERTRGHEWPCYHSRLQGRKQHALTRARQARKNIECNYWVSLKSSPPQGMQAKPLCTLFLEKITKANYQLRIQPSDCTQKVWIMDMYTIFQHSGLSIF